MIESNVKYFISEIISNDLEKYIDSEISIEVDYIIHQHDKMSYETASTEIMKLRYNLLEQIRKFYTIGAISFSKKCYLESYIKEKIGKTIFYIQTIIYESEVND